MTVSVYRSNGFWQRWEVPTFERVGPKPKRINARHMYFIFSSSSSSSLPTSSSSLPAQVELKGSRVSIPLRNYCQFSGVTRETERWIDGKWMVWTDRKDREWGGNFTKIPVLLCLPLLLVFFPTLIVLPFSIEFSSRLNIKHQRIVSTLYTTTLVQHHLQ